jgi:hypothetical protein
LAPASAGEPDPPLWHDQPSPDRLPEQPASPPKLSEERAAYAEAARQGLLLDEELETLEPTPHEFKFRFRDKESEHTYTNGDWEAHAMFYNGRRRGQTEAEVLA